MQILTFMEYKLNLIFGFFLRNRCEQNFGPTVEESKAAPADMFDINLV